MDNHVGRNLMPAVGRCENVGRWGEQNKGNLGSHGPKIFHPLNKFQKWINPLKWTGAYVSNFSLILIGIGKERIN